MQGRLFSVITVSVSTAVALACGATPSPNAPTPPPPSSPPSPSVTAVFYPGSDRYYVPPGDIVQLRALARSADGSIGDITDRATWQSSNTVVAAVSETGLLTAAQEGLAEIRAAYQGVTGHPLLVTVRRPPRTGPPSPDEVIGRVHEVAPMEDVDVPFARVEISGGEHDGRFVTAGWIGEFRIDGIQRAGFDLLVSKSGYRSTRYRIVELPRDASSSIALEPEPWLVSEVFQGNLCAQNPKSTFFTPRGGGLFRITSYRMALFESGPMLLLVNGVKAFPIVGMGTDYPLQAGTVYEFRVSGATDYPSCTPGPYNPYNGSFRVTYLRPR